MPRYYFDVIDGGEAAPDAFGIELSGDDEARDQAVGLLPDIARGRLPNGDAHEFVVRARNAKGQIVYEANLTLNGRWWPGQRG